MRPYSQSGGGVRFLATPVWWPIVPIPQGPGRPFRRPARPIPATDAMCRQEPLMSAVGGWD
jgi:hypothetical protein